MSTPYAPPTPLVLSYVDPDGNNWNLSDRSMSQGYVCSAISGIQGYPMAVQTIPLLDGTALTNIDIPQPGTITLAVFVSRPSSQVENDYYALLDSLVRAFVTRRMELPASGTIIVQRPNGLARQISTYTTSGFDTPEEDVGANGTIYTFTLQTPDPFWYDPNVNSLTFTLNYASGILPLLPIWLAGATILGNTTINNPGTVITYPTWTITGPGVPTIQNLTSGLTWSLSQNVPAGQVVQVVTTRGKQTAVNQSTGLSVWDQVVYQSPRNLWGLVPGNNNLNISISGATAATQVSLSWQNRYNRA